MYKLNISPFTNKEDSVTLIKQEETVLCIPFDEANTDYQEYLKWLAEGNTPEPADEPA